MNFKTLVVVVVVAVTICGGIMPATTMPLEQGDMDETNALIQTQGDSDESVSYEIV